MKFSLKYNFRRYRKVKKLNNEFKAQKKEIVLNTNSKITFKKFENPLVSIIIPFYNQIDYTLNCLNHLSENLDENISHEIILVDDNSTESYDFSNIENLVLIKNTENLGFLKNCNKGIHASNGKYIYFLNNDTEVQKDFLKELLFVFEKFPNVGAVGSLLLNHDGSMQEAGSVIMKNFKIRQISKNRKPYFPTIKYINKVDYCSGCSLLFKKYKDDGSTNLLDENFAPAYFEETDFCFDLKYNQGKDIYYTPFSKVMHFNGVSYNQKSESNDEAKLKKKKELFEKNAALFKAKWGHIIQNIKATTEEERILEKFDNKSIIFYNSNVPEYDKDSGANRLMEIMVAYKNLGYHVSLVCERNWFQSKYNEFYQRLGICVFYEYHKLWNYKYFLKKNYPKSVKSIHWFYGPGTFEKFKKAVKNTLPNSYFVYDMVDIHHLRFKRSIELEPNDSSLKRRYKKYLAIETKSIKSADKIIAISDFEYEYMQQFLPKEKLVTISNVHYPKIDFNKVLPFSDRKDILFIGSSHTPNIDALYFLYNEIMPLVWKEIPELKVNVIGNVKECINDIKNDNFIFHGYVPDITTFFASNKMNVASLRYGAGVKGKIGQAFEYYLPVVTTSIGAEGMQLKNRENALIDDSASGFAKAIVELYTNETLWKHLQSNSEDSLKPFSKEKLIETIKTL